MGRKDIHSAIIPGGSISPSSGAICPVSLPSPCFPSSLPLPLLDGPHIIPAPSHCKASSARVQAGKAAPTAMILWRRARCAPHLHSHPQQQPFSRTHAPGLFLNDILLPGCGGKKKEKKERNTLLRIQAEDGMIAKC